MNYYAVCTNKKSDWLGEVKCSYCIPVRKEKKRSSWMKRTFTSLKKLIKGGN